ncbi:membrane protein insertase YidC [Pajaroellobacter abortibovis]|nr:membrane protein insertase YidC [Pajaroellobacter abortibovis]
MRWIMIALGVLLFWKWGLPTFTGSHLKTQDIPVERYVDAPGFIPDRIDPPAPGQNIGEKAPEGTLCTLQGNRFAAELSTRGASITHFYLQEEKYAQSEARDMSTTPDHERWRSLRTLFRGEEGWDQVAFDRFEWRLAESKSDACVFAYEDANVNIRKTIQAGSRPYELAVETILTNLSDQRKSHRFSSSIFAFRFNREIKGHLGRVSPFVTELSCAKTGEVIQKSREDFKEGGWFTQKNSNRYTAISNYYFAQALVPKEEQETPDCQILTEYWTHAGQSIDDDQAGNVYHARLLYPARSLAPSESATYRQIAFFGPKDRSVLAQAGGQGGLSDLINLGFFSPVAKVLVSVLLFLHGIIPGKSWGIAIILMTLGMRLLLFPLSWKGIQISLRMRRLKPEMEAIQARFADNLQAKNLAIMELYRQHGINPLGGCLPQLVQMPVWFAMYTTLQTAVEMYRTQFLWFKDLSTPDEYYILPLVLGGCMIIQQCLLPQQGMDPLQQKMMAYIMPAFFTLMMLFLPAALGIYMLANSLLGIVQQLAVERIVPRLTTSPKGAILVKQENSSETSS